MISCCKTAPDEISAGGIFIPAVNPKYAPGSFASRDGHAHGMNIQTLSPRTVVPMTAAVTRPPMPMPIEAPVPREKLSHRWIARRGSVPNSSRIMAKINMTQPFTFPEKRYSSRYKDEQGNHCTTVLQRNSVQNFPAYRDLRECCAEIPCEFACQCFFLDDERCQMLMARGTTSAAHAM